MDFEKQIDYQIWAENKILNQIENKITNESWELVDSELNKSLQNIYFHKYEVMWSWIELIKGSNLEEVEFPENNKSISETKNWMIALFEQMMVLVKETEDKELSIYLPWLKRNYSISRNEVLFNILNHHTYHRGQVVMLMKKVLGILDTVETDYNPYMYEKIGL